MNGVFASARDEHAAVGRDDHVVGTEVDVEIAEAAVFFGVDDADCAAAPIADVEVDLISAHDAGVRKFADSNLRFEMEIFWIDDEDFVRGFVADIDFAGGRMDGEAGEEGLFETDDGFVGFGERDVAFVVVEDVEFARRAARDVDLAAVFAEGEAVEAGFEREELGDATRGGVEDGEARVVVAAADGEQTGAVGRNDHAQGHVAHN